jgi:hypothetical protein
MIDEKDILTVVGAGGGKPAPTPEPDESAEE